MLIWIIAAAAVAFVLWPTPEKKQQSQPSLLTRLPSAPAQPKPEGGSYLDAMAALSSVRARLSATGKLDDAVQKASDVITLALMAGSEQ